MTKDTFVCLDFIFKTTTHILMSKSDLVQLEPCISIIKTECSHLSSKDEHTMSYITSAKILPSVHCDVQFSLNILGMTDSEI